MTFLTRLLQRFRPTRYVGQDLAGNRFYEQTNTANGRPRRTVQYRNPEDVWQYIGGRQKLAIQWSTWLSHTRQHPPTLEELQTDAERQRRVQANVALIEARDREERAQVLRLQQESNTAKSIERPRELVGIHQQETQYPLEEQAQSEMVPEHNNNTSPLPKMGTGTDTYEPEAWTPRTHARGG
ncbi:hypothetical protein H2248_011980 [Termitomyces sp. 'cryptogamus']|nr:hypothetical protein H2248_011980 [Termitomyces sp. 'cryptogamus']